MKRKILSLVICLSLLAVSSVALARPKGDQGRPETGTATETSKETAKETSKETGKAPKKAPVKVEKPVASQKNGSYATPIKVTFTNKYASTVKVYYTTNKIYPNPLVVKALESKGSVKSNHGWQKLMKRTQDAVKVWDGKEIDITKTTTLRAVAIDTATMKMSTVATFRYVIGGKDEENTSGLKAPVASPVSGTYTAAVTVKFDTAGYKTTTKLYYTVDGTEPTAASKLYDAAGVAISATSTIKAIAIDGDVKSPVASYVYTIDAAAQAPKTPVASPAAGTFTAPVVAKFDMAGYNATTKLYYTVDNTEPTASSKLYDAVAGVTVNATTTVKAIAIDGGMKSQVATFAYVINAPQPLAALVATPAAGTFTGPVTVKFNMTGYASTAKVYYTVNGTEPTAASTLYDTAAGIVINATTTVKAIAIDGDAKSPVGTFAYTINTLALAAPVASPAAGTFTGAVVVKFDTTAYPTDTKVYYTLDNTDPTASSTLYDGVAGISLTATKVVKAIAINGDVKSAVTTASYTIN